MTTATPTAATVQQPAPVKSTDGRGCNSETGFQLRRLKLFDLADAVEERGYFGFEKYRAWLCPRDGRSKAIDAYQEALDLCVYLQGEVLEGCDDARADLLAAMALAERIRPRAERDFKAMYGKEQGQ